MVNYSPILLKDAVVDNIVHWVNIILSNIINNSSQTMYVFIFIKAL